jgi:3-deoxy-D-manno-octulosonic-acid transferase
LLVPADALFTRSLYSLGLYLLVPFALLRLGLLGLRDAAYWRSIKHRLGFIEKRDDDAMLLWLHAVSVGEVQAAGPIIEHFLSDYPTGRVMVTTSTPSGAQILSSRFGDEVAHRYVPFDLPGALARFIGRARPDALVIMETELWPNLIHACARRNIPVMMANGRISERSYSGYRLVSGIIGAALARFDVFAVQSALDAERLVALGADANRVTVTGNTKFDVHLAASVMENAEALRRLLGSDRPIFIAASTHPGEEEILLCAFAQIRKREPDVLLVLVPRHPDRAGRIMELCSENGFATVRRSSHLQCSADTAVYLVDTIGELPMFYAASDVSFVGGSLVEHGGHNVLEPAGLGVPVLAGPHTENFAEITGRLIEAGGLRIAQNAEELTATVLRLLANAEEQAEMGENGRQFVAANGGAADRVMGLLAPFLAVES